MLPLGALAVAVLLNGAQIVLPAPAFVEAGRTWAPARAIFQRLGHNVRWEPATQTMSLELGDRLAAFPLGATPTLNGRPLRVELAARRVEGTVYVPLLALRELGLKVHWDPVARQALLTAQLPTRSTSLIAILADPPAWNGQEVTLVGEYLGWTPDPFSFATQPGPPVSSGDWVLHNEDGSLYCSPGPAATPITATASLSPVTSPLPDLTPYAALGQRLAVSGTIKLSSQAVPYLQFTHLARPEGAAGLTCRLVLDRQAYYPGQRVTFTLIVANPHPMRVALGPLTDWSLTVSAPDGNMYSWKESFDNSTLAAHGLEGGKQATTVGEWLLPAEVPTGEYWIVAQLSADLGTYRQCFTVQPLENPLTSVESQP